MFPGEINWSNDLTDSLWFHIGQYLNIHDLDRLSRTCSRLRVLFHSHHFWSFRIRQEFGLKTWQRFIANTMSSSSSMKSIYFQLIKRHCISLTDTRYCSFNEHRVLITLSDSSSLTGDVLCLNDSISFCYSFCVRIRFVQMLPGKYEVIWRMKLDRPFILGQTDFLAVPEGHEIDPSNTSCSIRWNQDDFFSLYRCFHCEWTKTNLWFYQSMGFVQIVGDQKRDVLVSMINDNANHSKHGIYIDYVELKRQCD